MTACFTLIMHEVSGLLISQLLYLYTLVIIVRKYCMTVFFWNMGCSLVIVHGALAIQIRNFVTFSDAGHSSVTIHIGTRKQLISY